MGFWDNISKVLDVIIVFIVIVIVFNIYLHSYINDN